MKKTIVPTDFGSYLVDEDKVEEFNKDLKVIYYEHGNIFYQWKTWFDVKWDEWKIVPTDVESGE